MEIKYVEDSKLNKRVSQIIKELRDEIVSKFHPKSIILTGSFGRGEATVIERNGRLKFLSDCEIIIIPYKWIFNRRKLNKFEQEFYEKYGLKVEIWGFTYTLYLSFPFLNRRIKPTIANYDLKYGSKIIYGKDYLKKIPNFRPEDISIWEGIRLIFNRMAEALEYFSLKNPNVDMIFWTDKIVLACRDTLLLLAGKYHPSYRKRNEIFESIYSRSNEHFIQKLLDMSKHATERKLTGRISNIDPIRYWFSVSRICDKVFRYVFSKIGIIFTDYLDFQQKYIKLKETPLAFYQNMIKCLKVFINYKYKIPLRLLKVSYTDLIYSIVPLAYFELCGRDNDNVDKKYIEKCIEILSKFGVNCEPSVEKCLEKITMVWRYVR